MSLISVGKSVRCPEKFLFSEETVWTLNLTGIPSSTRILVMIGLLGLGLKTTMILDSEFLFFSYLMLLI